MGRITLGICGGGNTHIMNLGTLNTGKSVGKTKIWTCLNKECEQICPPPSESGWLITIGAVQHVWRGVNERKKFKYLEA
jgi:hypothetical protein